MAFVGYDAKVVEDSKRVEEKILQVCVNESSTVVANAALWIGLAICAKGGATREQIMSVCNGIMDSLKFERSN